MPDRQFKYDVGVIGGAGRVGLPLAMTFADCGLKTIIYDIDARRVDQIRRGVMPFEEEGADEMLPKLMAAGTLEADTTPERVPLCRFLVLIIGTPVDGHLNPNYSEILRVISSCEAYFRDGQILVLRSTIYPGISGHLQQQFEERGRDIRVAFCPERVAQGYSLREFRSLPQIVSAFDAQTLEATRGLFSRFAPELVEMAPMEAELCKLMTNAWRYIQFATVNQFYMIASNNGLDFERILYGCRHNYPRMAGMPGPGFAAGPCLVKDTMQLAAFSRNSFVLGHSAMLINEGMPSHLIELAKRETPLSGKVVGILGMAFKAESDDMRDSLSYKLRKLLMLEARIVLCSDPHLSDPQLLPPEEVVARSDVIFIATPHKAFRALDIPESKVVIDVWNCLRQRAATVKAADAGQRDAAGRRH